MHSVGGTITAFPCRNVRDTDEGGRVEESEIGRGMYQPKMSVQNTAVVTCPTRIDGIIEDK
jgi:hypothetical protein